jgi:hypothetical protein
VFRLQSAAEPLQPTVTTETLEPSSRLSGRLRQAARATGPTQAVRRSAKVPATLYTWTRRGLQGQNCAPLHRVDKRCGRGIRYRTEEERRAAALLAGRARTRRYRAKLAVQEGRLGKPLNERSMEFQVVMDPLAVLLGEARTSTWYY